MNTREGLVEDDDIRVQHQQPPQLQQLLLAARQSLRVFVAQVIHGQELQHPHCLVVDLGLGFVAAHGQRRDIEIFQHAHAPERAGHLEGPAQPRPRYLVGLVLVNPLAVQINRAAVGLDRPVEHVGQRGLAGAVGADQADQFRPIDLERDAFQGMEPAEAFMQVLYNEVDHFAAPASLVPASLAAVPRFATVSPATWPRLK
jgi:hypothetical protein